MSISELLPALLTRYSQTSLLIMAPELPDQAAEAVARWMKRRWALNDGSGRVDVVSRLTVITDLDESVSPMAAGWLKDDPFGGRMTLVGRRQPETVILLPDIAVVGPVNMRYGRNFTATVTTVREQVDRLWAELLPASGQEGTADGGEGPAPTASGAAGEDAGTRVSPRRRRR